MAKVEYGRFRSRLESARCCIRRAEEACSEASWHNGPSAYVLQQLRFAMSLVQSAEFLAGWQSQNIASGGSDDDSGS